MRWRRRKQREQDLERELQSDLALEAEEQQEKGLSLEDARYAALRAFGNPTYMKEETRAMWGWMWFERRKQDLQYAIRVLRKAPVFTTAAILTLALGIGANSAIFNILHALVLRSLPVSDPERLVVVTRNETVSSPYPLFAELRDQGWMVFVAGYTPTTNEPAKTPWVGFISPGYFETMGIPLLLGRDINDHDMMTRHNVAVVNETFALHFFGRDNPVGRRLGMKEGVYDWEIIGVVKDSKYTGLREEPTRMMYVPARPGPWASRTVVHLRTPGNPAALASALRQKVHELDKTATISNVHTVQDELDRSLSRERLLGTITSLFGALALLLAVIGLYGLVAYGVARRTREFAIRIAVGAEAGGIVRLVLLEAVWLLAAGTTIGLAAAWVFGRVISSMLFGIQAADPLSAVVAVLVLAVVALVAAWIPARRASRIHPMAALKYE